MTAKWGEEWRWAGLASCQEQTAFSCLVVTRPNIHRRNLHIDGHIGNASDFLPVFADFYLAMESWCIIFFVTKGLDELQGNFLTILATSSNTSIFSWVIGIKGIPSMLIHPTCVLNTGYAHSHSIVNIFPWNWRLIQYFLCFMSIFTPPFVVIICLYFRITDFY